MEEYGYLGDLAPGESCRVAEVRAPGAMHRRMLDIGLVPDTLVCCVGCSPAGDPAAYLIRGAVIAIRRRDAQFVRVIR